MFDDNEFIERAKEVLEEILAPQKLNFNAVSKYLAFELYVTSVEELNRLGMEIHPKDQMNPYRVLQAFRILASTTGTHYFHVHPRSCDWCERWYACATTYSQYCSPKCRTAHFRQNRG